MSNPDKRSRLFVLVSFTGLLIVQIMQALGIDKYTPVMRQFWDWYGADLASLTLYHYHNTKIFLLVPLITLLISIDILRRKSTPFRYATVSFIVLAILTATIQVWVIEPMFRPIESMIINR